MCFVDIEKAFDRVPRKAMEWAMRKKGLSEVIVRAVMSLCHGTKTKVRVGSKLSEKFLIQVGVHHGSVLSPLLFAIAVDVILENARKGLMIEILYADDLVLMSEKKVGFTLFFPRFAGSDVLIQYMSKTTHSISNFVLEQRSTLNSECSS